MRKAVEKEIPVGDVKAIFACSAAFPGIYTRLIGRDFWADYERILNERDFDLCQDMAYAMAWHAADGDLPEKEEWCMQFSIMDFISTMPEIVAVLSMSTKTTSVPKNQDGERSA